MTPNPSSLARNWRLHHVHALNQRVDPVGGRARPGRVDGAIEVVDDVEEIGEDLAPAAFDVLADLAPQPQPRLLELGRRAAIPRDGVLQLLVLFRELLFQLLDVGRLERRAAARGPAVALASWLAHHRRSTTLTGISCLFVAHGAAWWLLGPRLEGEGELVVGEVDDDGAAVLELAEQDFVGQRIAHLGLDHPRERARAVDRVVALAASHSRAAGSSVIATRRSASCDSSCRMNFSTIVSITPGDSGPNDTIASRRLRNSGLKTFSIGLFRALLRRLLPAVDGAVGRGRIPEADGPGAQLARAGVRGHDQHHLAEVGLAAVVVGQRGVVHHLQQDVEDVGVRLLDFVEQQHRVGMLADRVDEQPALLEADVARRRANQPGDRVLLHVLAHVEADELVAEVQRELLGELGLADAGRAGEEETAGRAVGLAEPGARSLDGAGDGADRLLLSEHHPAERFLERAQPIAIGGRGLLGGNAGDAGDHFFDLADPDLDDLAISDGPRSSTAAAPAASARARRPRRARRSRCRAACSRACGAPPAWPPTPARRR